MISKDVSLSRNLSEGFHHEGFPLMIYIVPNDNASTGDVKIAHIHACSIATSMHLSITNVLRNEQMFN